MMNAEHLDPTAFAPGRHDKEGRQRALLDAALAVFSERGYDAATTRQVARRAGVSEGLIHRYFGGKRGLLLAALAARYEDVAVALAANLEEARTAREEIERMLTWPLDAMLEKQEFLRVSVAQSILDREIGHIVGTMVNQQRVNLMAGRLLAHQHAGRIRPEVDVQALAGIIAGYTLMAGFFGQIIFGLDRRVLRAQALQTAEILCHGILPNPITNGADA